MKFTQRKTFSIYVSELSALITLMVIMIGLKLIPFPGKETLTISDGEFIIIGLLFWVLFIHYLNAVYSDTK